MDQKKQDLDVVMGFVMFGAVTYGMWLLVRHTFITEGCQIPIWGLVKENFLRQHDAGYFAWRWTPLMRCGYQNWFGLSLWPGIAAMIGCFTLVNDNNALTALKTMAWSLLGGAVGLVIGAIVFWLWPWDMPLAHALVMSFFVVVFGIIGGSIYPSNRLTSVRRGTRILERLTTSNSPAKLLKKAIQNKQTILAGVLLDRESEVRHFAIMGTTGTGKSVALRQLMDTSLRRNDRNVTADPDGGYMQLFFREGDLILNPFDARCVKWDYFSEIETESDYRFMAASILPYSGDSKGNQWIEYGQQLITAASRAWHENKLGDSCSFFNTLATASTEHLGLLCKGSSAARFFEAGNERMLGSILSTVAPALEALRPLMHVQGKPFSIRRWIREGNGSLWMPYKANQIAALRGIVSCWMRIAIFETLSLEADLNRRIWFHIDELDALGRIEGLKDALARIRKFGGCVALGFQSISQLRAVYGSADANTLIETCNNKLILRCEASEGGGTAEFACTQIGEREVEYDVVSHSVSRRDGGQANTVSTAPRQKTESAVLASEIMQLPDMTGYMKISSQPYWEKVKFDYVEYSKQVETFIPLKKSGVELGKT